MLLWLINRRCLTSEMNMTHQYNISDTPIRMNKCSSRSNQNTRYLDQSIIKTRNNAPVSLGSRQYNTETFDNIRDDDSRTFNRPERYVKHITEPEYKSYSSSQIHHPIRNSEERYSSESEFRDSNKANCRQQPRETYSPKLNHHSRSSRMTKISLENGDKVHLGQSESDFRHIDNETYNRQQRRDTYSPELGCRTHSYSITKLSSTYSKKRYLNENELRDNKNKAYNRQNLSDNYMPEPDCQVRSSNMAKLPPRNIEERHFNENLFRDNTNKVSSRKVVKEIKYTIQLDCQTFSSKTAVPSRKSEGRCSNTSKFSDHDDETYMRQEQFDNYTTELDGHFHSSSMTSRSNTKIHLDMIEDEILNIYDEYSQPILQQKDDQCKEFDDDVVRKSRLSLCDTDNNDPRNDKFESYIQLSRNSPDSYINEYRGDILGDRDFFGTKRKAQSDSDNEHKNIKSMKISDNRSRQMKQDTANNREQFQPLESALPTELFPRHKMLNSCEILEHKFSPNKQISNKVSKSMPVPVQFDNVVIFYFLHENNTMVSMEDEVLCDSFARSGVTEKLMFNVKAHPTEQRMSECTLVWKNVSLAYAFAKSEKAARQKTAVTVLEHLAETCYTIRANSSYYSHEGYKMKLAKGNRPGVYRLITRKDAPTIKAALKLIDNFFNEDTDCDLVFGTYYDFSIKELTLIKTHAKEKKGLEYLSEDQSHVMVFKKRTAQYWRDKLLAGDTVASEKFSLEPPQQVLTIFRQIRSMIYGPNSETQSSSATLNQHKPHSFPQEKIPQHTLQSSSATSNQQKPLLYIQENIPQHTLQSSSTTSNQHKPHSFPQEKIPQQSSSLTSNQHKPLSFPQEKIPQQTIQTSSLTSNQHKPLSFPQEKIPQQTSSATSNQHKPLLFTQDNIPQQTLQVDPNKLMSGLTRGQTNDVGSLPLQTDQLWVTTWDVGGAYEPKDREGINDELRERGDIIALQETNLPTGLAETKDFTWYCSGGLGAKPETGVAILIRKSAPIHILLTSCYSDSVMSVSGIWKDVPFTVVCCYLPPANNVNYESTAADITAKLSEATTTTILLGNFNAHIGFDDRTAREQHRIGRTLYHGTSNTNGKLLKSLACCYNLDFCSTRDFKAQRGSFPLVTCKIGKDQAQLDYILVTDLGALKSIQVEAYWASGGKKSDHKLVSICLEKSKAFSAQHTLSGHTPNHTTNRPGEERGMLESQQNVLNMGGVIQPPAPLEASMATVMNIGMAWPVNPVNTLNAIHSVPPRTAAPHIQAVAPTFQPPVMAAAPSLVAQFLVNTNSANKTPTVQFKPSSNSKERIEEANSMGGMQGMFPPMPQSKSKCLPTERHLKNEGGVAGVKRQNFSKEFFCL